MTNASECNTTRRSRLPEIALPAVVRCRPDIPQTPDTIAAALQAQADDRREFEATMGLKLDADGNVILPASWKLFVEHR